MLVSLNPELYSPFVTEEKGAPILYMELLKALYGTLQAALLFYKKLKKDLEGIGFKINPMIPVLPTAQLMATNIRLCGMSMTSNLVT
jgi:hypothetical protein